MLHTLPIEWNLLNKNINTNFKISRSVSSNSGVNENLPIQIDEKMNDWKNGYSEKRFSSIQALQISNASVKPEIPSKTETISQNCSSIMDKDEFRPEIEATTNTPLPESLEVEEEAPMEITHLVWARRVFDEIVMDLKSNPYSGYIAYAIFKPPRNGDLAKDPFIQRLIDSINGYPEHRAIETPIVNSIAKPKAKSKAKPKAKRKI